MRTVLTKRRRWGDRPAQPAEHWENVLMQVALAFTVMLGFLVSQEAFRASAAASGLEAFKENIEKNSKFDLAFDAFEANKAAQLQRLMAAWEGVKNKQDFFNLMTVLSRRANGDDAWCEPDDNYRQLLEVLDESPRLFPEGADGTSHEKLVGLLSETCIKAKLTDQLTPDLLKTCARSDSRQPGGHPVTEKERNTEDLQYTGGQCEWDRAPHPQNLRLVAQIIRTDLCTARADLRKLQYTLILRKAVSELTAFQPTGEEMGAKAVLRRDLDRWNVTYHLLDEVYRDLIQ